MTCRERQAKFAEWILGELPAAEAQGLELHVEQCPACVRAWSEYRGLDQALRQHLTDREMPARLVFLGQSPRATSAGFIGSLWRAGAAGVVAAVIFLGLIYAGLPTPLPLNAPPKQATLTRAEVEALVARALEARLGQQKREFEAANASLRREQARTLTAVGQKLSYLESVQSTVWKETQQQGALVEFIARNSLPPESAPGKNR